MRVLHLPTLPVRVAGLTISLLAGVLLAQSAQAQTGTSAELQTPVGASDLSAQPNDNLGSFGGMFNLFHQMQMGGIRNSYEFNRAQQESFGTAASDFRQQQQELLRQRAQQGTAPANTIVSPQTAPAAPSQTVNP